MTLRIGVIGTGVMGASHVQTLASSVPGVAVTSVFDMATSRASDVAASVGASVASSPEELISSADVDAVLIASPDSTHPDLAIACIDAGKPTLCEKPLAPTAKEALRVVEAEVATGRALVQLGFVRRFDPGFRSLRQVVAGGSLGRPRVVHAVHRNASSLTSTDDATLVSGSMIHEFDTVAWLLDDPFVGVRVESPVTSGFRDPQLATLWTAGGVMVTAEVFVNASYGYDVRCEVVGTDGTASLVPTAAVSTRVAGVSGLPVLPDFVVHFADAYRIELVAWAVAAAGGTIDGPSAWDGYVANVVAEAGIASLQSGQREVVDPGERPALYA